MVKWETIGSLIKRKRIKAKSLKESSPVYAVTNTEGFVLSSSLHDFTIHSEDTSNYLVVNKNDFAYNPSRLNIGSISYFNKEGNGLISPMYVVFHADERIVNPEYLYLVIKLEGIRNKIYALKEVGARFRFDFSRWDLINIPIPSLEEQSRIVDTLNTFKDSIENLKKQIAQRKKQYEFYRDQLLALEGKEGVDMKALGSVSIRISSGKNKSKSKEGKYPVFGSTGIIAFSNSFFYDTPMILVARVGANAGFVHLSYGKYDVTDNTLIIELNEEVDQKYIYYNLVKENINQYAKGGGQPLITATILKSIIVPVPPLSEQQRIVSLLDTFEASISNLEAQLEHRQKQYEYYRNKLLTFE